MCVRLRQAGWRIWRLTEPMILHEAAMYRFGQWWKRGVRGGYRRIDVPRAPVIGDIGAGAKILGPITIGNNVAIGANGRQTFDS